MGSSLVRRSLPLAVLIGFSCSSAEMAAVLAPAPAVARTTVALKLRRFGDRVDLVVSGLGNLAFEPSTATAIPCFHLGALTHLATAIAACAITAEPAL